VKTEKQKGRKRGGVLKKQKRNGGGKKGVQFFGMHQWLQDNFLIMGKRGKNGCGSRKMAPGQQ